MFLGWVLFCYLGPFREAGIFVPSIFRDFKPGSVYYWLFAILVNWEFKFEGLGRMFTAQKLYTQPHEIFISKHQIKFFKVSSPPERMNGLQVIHLEC